MGTLPPEDSIPTRDGIKDCELDKFTKTFSEKRSIRTTQDGRTSTPTSADFLSAFNPMGLPLLPFNRAIEIPRDMGTAEYPTGIYFLNKTYIQYYATIQISPFYDAEIVENNILLLNDGDALKLNVPSGPSILDIPAFTDTFLGIN